VRGERHRTGFKKEQGAQQQTESSRPRARGGHQDLSPPSCMHSSVKDLASKKESAVHELVARRQRAQDPCLQWKCQDSGPVSSCGKDAESPRRCKAHESVSYR
jgi:hypothetical protein